MKTIDGTNSQRPAMTPGIDETGRAMNAAQPIARIGYALPLGSALLFLLLMLSAPTALPMQLPTDGPQDWPDLPSVRGTVKSVHGNDAAIETEAGKQYTIHTSDNTHLYSNRQPIKMSQVRVGDVLIAAGSLDEKSAMLRAIFVADVDAATVQKLREELGKTWIAGKVLKIEETRITIDRIDHHVQGIDADETTSFRKDAQSVTLLDLHVGDRIRGKGTVKNGVFVPTELTILDAGRRHSRGAGALPPGGP